MGGFVSVIEDFFAPNMWERWFIIGNEKCNHCQ